MSGNSGTEGGTLYWTLSLPVCTPNENCQLDLVSRLRNQQATKDLRAAMEPMFHDIADLERPGGHGFLAATTSQSSRHLLCTLDPRDESDDCSLSWQTEGSTCVLRLGNPISKVMTLRRFWYVHNDNSLSYHLSFVLPSYKHRPRDFFFISMLQKLTAPREFSLELRQEAKWYGAFLPPWMVQDFLPFSAFTVGYRGNGVRKDKAFWEFVHDRFTWDLCEISSVDCVNCHVSEMANLPIEDYLESPGVKLPQARSIFSFHDHVLFSLLLPKSGQQSVPRHERIFDRDYRMISAVISRLSENKRSVLDDDFLKWLEEGLWDDPPWQSNAQLTHIRFDEIFRELTQNDEMRTFDWPTFRRDRMRYLFLAGFNQNVIDFLNQDASEVLDSLDPIYPSEENEVEERFFVRYANPRALISYAKTWRSLDIGTRYIGNCPYVFLIHLHAMHNELLARDFEKKAVDLIEKVPDWHRKRELTPASNAFSEFRIGPHLDFERTYWDNIFRYNTEQELFEALQSIRGTARKHARIGELLTILEQETRSIEGRIKDRKAYVLNGMVSALAIFTVSQALKAEAGIVHVVAAFPLKSWAAQIVPWITPIPLRSVVSGLLDLIGVWLFLWLLWLLLGGVSGIGLHLRNLKFWPIKGNEAAAAKPPKQASPPDG